MGHSRDTGKARKCPVHAFQNQHIGLLFIAGDYGVVPRQCPTGK